MKNLFLLVIAAVIVSSCGVGAAIATDLAMISCSAPSKTTVTVSVDNKSYNVKTSVSKTYSTSSKKKSSKKVAAQPAPVQPSQPAAQPQVNQSDRKTTTNRTSSTSRSTTSSTSRRAATNTSSSSSTAKNTTSSGRTAQDNSTSSRRTSTVTVEPGEHDVKVTDKEGNEVYSGRVDLSASEHKVIELKQ